VLAGLRRHLADDLDAPGALSVVDRWAERTLGAGEGGDPETPALVSRAVDALLGVALRPTPGD
jgi:L-cysteine:1D-myo-inositol 2-amino-2-deoxy-alpha-D-glucopyranoside ligase